MCFPFRFSWAMHSVFNVRSENIRNVVVNVVAALLGDMDLELVD